MSRSGTDGAAARPFRSRPPVRENAAMTAVPPPASRPEADDNGSTGTMTPPATLSDELERWLTGEAPKTLGGLIETFGAKSFAVLFVVLLGVPALPLPTGGATHVFEVIAVLTALQLIVGRDEVWLPQRWRGTELGGDRQQRFITSLMKLIRRLERISRPRLAFVFRMRFVNQVFGLVVILGSAAAFFAPPFTGLDTLPALGVVLFSLGVLLEDMLIVAIALVLIVIGIVLEVVLGAAAFHGLHSLL